MKHNKLKTSEEGDNKTKQIGKWKEEEKNKNELTKQLFQLLNLRANSLTDKLYTH